MQNAQTRTGMRVVHVDVNVSMSFQSTFNNKYRHHLPAFKLYRNLDNKPINAGFRCLKIMFTDVCVGRDGSIGIVTRYGVDGPGI
jgi:hypothetical protein